MLSIRSIINSNEFRIL